MSTVAEYEVLSSDLGGISHAFLPGQPGDLRAAACGEKALDLLLKPSSEPVPQCLECALKFGAQVDVALVEAERARRAAVDDAVTSAAVTRIDEFIAVASRLDGPAQAKVIHDLSRESGTVRVWARWNTLSSMLMVAGTSGLSIGIFDVATKTSSGWTVAALIAGAAALLASGINGSRVNHSALLVAIGVQRTSRPADDAARQPEADESS